MNIYQFAAVCYSCAVFLCPYERMLFKRRRLKHLYMLSRRIIYFSITRLELYRTIKIWSNEFKHCSTTQKGNLANSNDLQKERIAIFKTKE
jgi:hypothetical protein